MILSVFTLVSISSCQKEISTDTTKTSDAFKGHLIPISQIVFTDVNPDSTIACIKPCHHEFDLDLNNDGVIDFIFSVIATSARCATELSSGRNLNYVSVIPARESKNMIECNGNYPARLDSLAIINNTNMSVASAKILRRCESCFGSGSYFWGDWDNNEYKYLGLKLIKSTNTYYGWVRLSVTANGLGSKLTIRDYAYNNIPNQPIQAGQYTVQTD